MSGALTAPIGSCMCTPVGNKGQFWTQHSFIMLHARGTLVQERAALSVLLSG